MSNQRVVLASNNAGKLTELKGLLSSLELALIAQSELNITEAIEDGLSFVENALIKARHASVHSGLPAIADDSGLAVDALDGKPGIHSARFAGSAANDERNNAKLLQELLNIPDAQRTAQFHCALVFVRSHDDPVPIICQGIWHGRILQEAQGTQGFGYDPLFYVPTHACTSAELDRIEKNRISHRALAMQQLLNHLTINPDSRK